MCFTLTFVFLYCLLRWFSLRTWSTFLTLWGYRNLGLFFTLFAAPRHFILIFLLFNSFFLPHIVTRYLLLFGCFFSLWNVLFVILLFHSLCVLASSPVRPLAYILYFQFIRLTSFFGQVINSLYLTTLTCLQLVTLALSRLCYFGSIPLHRSFLDLRILWSLCPLLFFSLSDLFPLLVPPTWRPHLFSLRVFVHVLPWGPFFLLHDILFWPLPSAHFVSFLPTRSFTAQLDSSPGYVLLVLYLSRPWYFHVFL